MPNTMGPKNYARNPDVLSLPSLIEIQLDSFKWFLENGLVELFDEISPIESYNGGIKIYFPGKSQEARDYNLKLSFGDIKYTQDECVDRDLTYAAPLYVDVLLTGADLPEPMVHPIFMGDFPLMTEKGTFIINGTERVVVSQLIRSPGVYFDVEEDRSSGRRLSSAKLIPDRGAWMEFETRKTDYLTVKFNRKRTVPITMLLRALAAIADGTEDQPIKYGTDEELLALFAEVDTQPERQFIAATIRQEPTWEATSRRSVAEVALVEFYKRMRPGDPPTLENAKEYLQQQLFDQRRYDTERVGRYKLNQKLGLTEIISPDTRTITQLDLIHLVKRMIEINNGQLDPDDVDHLGNRRVKTVGELIQAKMRVGLRRTERVIRERMSIRGEQDTLSPVNLINIRPIVASVREFFGSSQLSQFMDQTNPLAELRHKRTISALGPGGLRRERAGFDVRDVHHSHYGRICPIETPEGPNIGLIGRLASHARVNALGFIETPYRRVIRALPADDPQLVGRLLRRDLLGKDEETVIHKASDRITEKDIAKIKKAVGKNYVEIVPFVSDDIRFLSADIEDKYVIAQGNTPLDDYNEFLRARPSCRNHSEFIFAEPRRIDYMDVTPRQIVGISAALIPFLAHDDPTRALMGSNMMSQAVPLIKPEVPLVGTGMEEFAARDSGQVVVAEFDGEVVSVTGGAIVLQDDQGNRHTYRMRKYQRSNQSTSIDQRPVVVKGQRVNKGTVIADSSSTKGGQLALGQDVLVAYMSWEGGNYEDAILISERLIREDMFTSVHIEKHEVEARDTKLGPEEITYDIPNVGEDTLKDLDERGIVRIGAQVGPNDILVGKITPKGEKELTPEEKLLRAIFGEKAREVKDTSLRMPHGQKGKVVDVRVFSRDDYRDLQAGVEQMVRVSVAERRKLTEGDKMAGRHGNKGVISKIVPIADMPYLVDGRPIDVILSPLGVPGRMNIGQIFETQLGWAAERLGFRAVVPVFDGATEYEIEGELARAWLIDAAWNDIQAKAWQALEDQGADSEMLEDDLQAIRIYIEAWLGNKYNPDLLATNLTYARRAVLLEWLREKGYQPETAIHYEDENLDHDAREVRVDHAVLACLREWVRHHGTETDSTDIEELRAIADKVMRETGAVNPLLGKMTLIDGYTGRNYDSPVTVGVTHMLKLHHLVEDKVHARSTGPYSLVTQQPLGGKAQFGGQRFGEMEVWALEAYGAAYMLQEMLTVKSDDTQGRVKTYESIVKGEPIEAPGIPASFRVLVKELQSLGLAVEAVSENGEIIRFGKDEEKQRQPRLGGLGLLGFASPERSNE